MPPAPSAGRPRTVCPSQPRTAGARLERFEPGRPAAGGNTGGSEAGVIVDPDPWRRGRELQTWSCVSSAVAHRPESNPKGLLMLEETPELAILGDTFA